MGVAFWEVAGVLTLAFAAVACGGQVNANVSCSYAGSCPKDPPRTADQILGCQASIDDAMCGALWQQLINCVAPVEVCAPDGTEDLKATFLAGSPKCGGVRKAWDVCVYEESTDASIE